MSLSGQRLDERDELVLAVARHAGRDVDDRVRVRADEVQRAGRSAPRPRADRARAPTSAASAARSRCACRRASARAATACRRPPAPSARRTAPPRPPSAAPSRSAWPPSSAAQVSGVMALDRPARRALALADLVPLDLERHQRRHEVVDVRRAREQHRERAVGALVPAPPARRRLGLGPRLDVDPAASNTSTSWPITISDAPTMPSGRRRIAYRNAPRSSSSLPASGCRLEPIARCDGSSTRNRVSPLERSSVVYVRW